MKKLVAFTVGFIAASSFLAEAAPPVVSNVRAAQIAGTKNVEILYDVSDADGDTLTIGMQVSGDAGQTYTIPATALSGHIGAGVAPGVNRRIVWNAGADWNGQLVSSAKVRVTASDGTTPAPPPGMVYIPAGVFQMGDNFNEIGSDTLPVHFVNVDGFFMERFEVTKELWQSVQTWAVANGYTDLPAGTFTAAGHPMHSISWYSVVKWCNARSEKEGRTPVYYTDDAQTTVYRTSSHDLTNAKVKWSANGYRLPTEAEWEKAARGGARGLRYPSGNGINGSQANYGSSGDPFDNNTTPVGFYNGSQVPPESIWRTVTVSTTWQETCMSGAGIGTAVRTTETPPLGTTHMAPRLGAIECSGEGGAPMVLVLSESHFAGTHGRLVRVGHHQAETSDFGA